jgi:hypothetical protein
MLLVERVHVRFRELRFAGRERGNDPAKHLALRRVGGLLDQTASLLEWILARSRLTSALANEDWEGGWFQRYPDIL